MNEIPKTFTFEGNVSERDIAAFVIGDQVKGHPILFIWGDRKRPDDVRVKATLEVLGLNNRQEAIINKVLKNKEPPKWYRPDWQRGDV